MKPLFLRLIVLLIAFMATDIQFSSKEQVSSDQYHLTKIPELDTDPLSTPKVREHKQLNYIAQPFFPIVVLADSLYEVRDYSFYASVYPLNQRKEFFLLL